MQFSALELEVLDGMRARRPDLDTCVPALSALHQSLVSCYDAGGKLLVCGNGGSHADAVHITGELCKSFERARPLPRAFRERLMGAPFGRELASHLEVGLAAIPLGTNGSLKTAVENDSPMRDIAFAQEVMALGKPEDVVLGISTSGNADNCVMALSTAKAIGAVTVALTGPHGGAMAGMADVAVKAPGESTKVIQEAHLVLYHTFCALIEVHYFPDLR